MNKQNVLGVLCLVGCLSGIALHWQKLNAQPEHLVTEAVGDKYAYTKRYIEDGDLVCYHFPAIDKMECIPNYQLNWKKKSEN